MKIDGKFSTDGERIFNTVSGEAIPPEEPLIMFRGRDRNTLRVLRFYLEACEDDGCNELHLAGITQSIAKFEQFAAEYPERMKEPGVTRHFKLEDSQ
jgi:hypothetical protein